MRTCPSRLATVVLAVLLTACATDERIRSNAHDALNRGDYEASVNALEAGLRQQPDSISLRSSLLMTRAAAVDELVRQVLQQRRSGKFAEAKKTLDRALALDPGSRRAQALADELLVEQRQDASLQQALALDEKGQVDQALKTIEQSLKSNPRHEGLLSLQRRIEASRRAQQVATAQGALAETRPITLDFKDASLRTVLDVVSRNSGINFVMDKDIKSDARVNVFLRDARVEDALDLVIGTNQLAKKVLDAKTIVFYPNTPEKQKEYQEQVVRVFYLASSDAKGAAAFLKSMLKIREPFVEERTNMLALRESQENIQLAERLVALYDAGEPEVLLEVEVLEVSSKRLLQLGVNPPTSFSLTPLAPSGSTGLTLGNVEQLTRANIALGLGGATVDFKRELGDFTTLANPRIRARNKEKASVMIGDKIPVVTSTTGSTGFVSDSVNYLDVGLKVNVEPTVYADDEVAIKVSLEVSSLGTPVKTASGTLAYQIGTRNATTLLRLRDGETQMLAGLISRDERTSTTGLPGFADMPVLGRLLSDKQDSTNKTELVLAITPRVLRNVRKLEAQESELWVGTEAAPKLRPYGGLRALATQPVRVGGDALPAQLGANSVGPGATTPPATDADKPANLQLSWASPGTVKLGEVFEVKVMVKSELPLRGLPTDLLFDKSKFEIVDAQEGEYFKQNGASTSFSKGAQDSTGRLTLGVIRTQATGAQGEGVAFLLKFKAVSAGTSEIQLPKFVPLTLGAPPPPVAAVAPLLIKVTP